MPTFLFFPPVRKSRATDGEGTAEIEFDELFREEKAIPVAPSPKYQRARNRSSNFVCNPPKLPFDMIST